MYRPNCGVTVSSAALAFVHLLVCPTAGVPVAPPKWGATLVQAKERLLKRQRAAS